MTITNSFKSAVSDRDVRGIRIMMKDSLLVDPTFTEFDEMNRYAREVNGLFDAHDGRDFNENRLDWNDHYMNKLMVQVVGNFSQKRIDHLKKVVQHLRPTPRHRNPHQPRENKSSWDTNDKSYKEQKRQDEREHRIIHKKVISGGVAGGVVTGAVVALAGGSYASIAIGAVTGALTMGFIISKITN